MVFHTDIKDLWSSFTGQQEESVSVDFKIQKGLMILRGLEIEIGRVTKSASLYQQLGSPPTGEVEKTNHSYVSSQGNLSCDRMNSMEHNTDFLLSPIIIMPMTSLALQTNFMVLKTETTCTVQTLLPYINSHPSRRA